MEIKAVNVIGRIWGPVIEGNSKISGVKGPRVCQKSSGISEMERDEIWTFKI